MKAVSKLKLSCSFTRVFASSDEMVLMELMTYIVTYWVNRIISWTFLQELHKTLSLALADSELFLRFFAVSVWVKYIAVNRHAVN